MWDKYFWMLWKDEMLKRKWILASCYRKILKFGRLLTQTCQSTCSVKTQVYCVVEFIECLIVFLQPEEWPEFEEDEAEEEEAEEEEEEEEDINVDELEDMAQSLDEKEKEEKVMIMWKASNFTKQVLMVDLWQSNIAWINSYNSSINFMFNKPMKV